MNLVWIRERLRQHAGAIASLANGVPDEQARWKPTPETWSILEVVNHLADEEVLDFRTRIEYTLQRPDMPWPSIDPPEWVIEGRYNQRVLSDSIHRFLSERERSLEWLQSLKNPDWSLAYDHSRIGNITAADLLSSWLAHDLLHIRQLAGLQHRWLEQQFPGVSSSYAGEW